MIYAVKWLGAVQCSAQQHTNHERSLQKYFSCFCLVSVGFVALSFDCTVCSDKMELTKYHNNDRGDTWPLCASGKCVCTRWVSDWVLSAMRLPLQNWFVFTYLSFTLKLLCFTSEYSVEDYDCWWMMKMKWFERIGHGISLYYRVICVGWGCLNGRLRPHLQYIYIYIYIQSGPKKCIHFDIYFTCQSVYIFWPLCYIYTLYI
jgi:hypothetical protein